MNKPTSLMTMSLAAICCASLTVTTAAAQAASKGEYYMSSPGSIKAGPFATLEQCQATASGINGSCYQDPWATNPANALAQAPGKARHLRK